MRISIEDLKSDIIERFGKETGGTFFGLDETSYDYLTDGLIIKIVHYRDKTKRCCHS